MWPDPQEPADLVTFTEEILNRTLHFLYSIKFGKRRGILSFLLGLLFEKELTFLWRSKKVSSVRMLCLFLVYMRKQKMHISIGVHLSFL